MAGNDMMLGGSNNGKVWSFTPEAIKDDPVLQAGVRESFHRKLYFYVNNGLLNGMTPESNASGGAVWWVVTLQVLGGVCFIGFAALLVLFIVSERKAGGRKGDGAQ